MPSPAGYGSLKACVAKPPNATGKLPSILVIHESRGLNPHIEDITRRLALDGHLAFAPDVLAPLGGYPCDEDKARSLFATLDPSKTKQHMIASAQALMARPDSTGRVGVVGFCYGGGVAYMLVTQIPELAGAVPYYGNHPAAEKAVKVKSPLLIHFADMDDRINNAWPAYQAALKAAGVAHTSHRYPGTQHGFNNDTTPRFDAAAAKLWWDRTLAFLKQHLSA